MTEKPLVEQPSNWPTRKVGTLMVVLVAFEAAQRTGFDIDDKTVDLWIDVGQFVLAGVSAWLVQNRKV